SYVIISPKSVRPGTPLSISVNILHAVASVHVEAGLVDNAKNKIASASGAFSHGKPGTLSIMVPSGLHSGAYKLTVQGSGGVTFYNETDLEFVSKSMSLFIQTDKAMYKPGQTVNFRTFGVYPNLTVYTGSMNVSIYDPNSNKIKQWLNVDDSSGVITSLMVMDTQPVLGDWKLKVEAQGFSTEKVFTVAHYVLPKFEVTVELPPFALSSDNSITAKVKATYTYGKPVKGTVSVLAKLNYWYRPWNYQGDEPMVHLTAEINGEATLIIPLDHIKTVSQYMSGRSLVVEANVTESLNKITRNGNSNVQFYEKAVKMEFLQSNPKTFKPNLTYTAYLRVVEQDDRPLTGAKHQVSVTTRVTYDLPGVTPTPYAFYNPPQQTYNLPSMNYTLPDNGIVAIQVDIPNNATHINLDANYDGVTAFLSLDKTYSPSGNYIQLSLHSTNLQPNHPANFEIKSTEPISSAIYQVMSRGSIVATGGLAGSRTNTLSFSILITDLMAPNARIVVYYVRRDGEVVADSISFDVDGAFQNQVDIDFDTTRAQPGDNVHVVVKADAHSVVHLLAVDQSVLLLKSGNDVTATQVIDELKSYDSITQPHNPFCCGIMPLGRKKRMVWWPYPTYYGGSDAQQIFENAGVKVMTDATVYHHPTPNYFFPMAMMGAGMGAGGGMALNGAVAGGMAMTGGQQGLQEVTKVRSVFPETWLWTNETVGADGQVTISTTVPDTITSWIASAFAVNSVSGLGVSPSTAKIETFRPFFVSLNLPYSVVRDEQLALQANVFNYMTQDMNVLVTLEKSNDFRNIINDSNGHKQFVSQVATQQVHVPAGEAKSVFFPIVPASLGKIDITVKAQSTLAADAVKRQLLVEPEGVPKEYNFPVLIDLKNTSRFSKTIPISLPAGVVAGSQRVRVTAIGDLMGPTVSGLDQLLTMPYGCGEQTMIGFAPDIFVADYLSATGQLSGEIHDKAINFMEKGYQRELTFQHKDGSFSAFGDSDPSGSMWLSAFVVKSFHQAKKYVFIDDDTIKRAIEWMVARQNADGSFPEPGRVIHTDMQGGSSSGPALTAFVLVALLENKDIGGSVQERIKKATDKAVVYLESQLSTLTEDYPLAITSYALTLAHSNAANRVFATLESHAVVKDGMKHWHKPETKTTGHNSAIWTPPNQQSNPSDIEMTAYALMVYAQKNQFTAGLTVMKWLITQRNPRGGFSSTQDTVLALQALSSFARMAYSNNFNVHVNVTTENVLKSFDISQINALVLQTTELPSVPSEVHVSAIGNGMALVEVSVFFNVEQEIEEVSFQVDITMVKETVDFLTVKTCTTWLKEGASGMAVQEFGVPTGFEADLESIGTVLGLKKTETQNRKVILYFDEISTTPLCLTIDVVRTGLVAKSQPVAVRVYDYYKPANQVTKFYQSHVLQNSDICDVCAECGCNAARAHAGK
ncbi:hypothetical protein ACJMK2_033022, partial [Sinanodonta woodiana]